MTGEPKLSRRRGREARTQCWQIWFDEVCVGQIAEELGRNSTKFWNWQCGFSANGNDRDHRSGSAATYEEAREGFLAVWAEYLPKRTPAYFDEWRHQAAWTAEKYARWKRGERTAPPWPLPGFVFRATASS